MKLDHWTVRTVELSYRVGNQTKKECIAELVGYGMPESEAKQIVKGWFR